MKTRRFILLLAFALAKASTAVGAPDEPSKMERFKAGDLAPDFEVQMLDGGKFSLKEHRGKVVLVNFFATWCGPCLQEMPHLETEVWQKFKNRKFAMIALGREHTNEELRPFQKKQKVTFPMAGDTKREIFARYAEAYIPRTLLLDAQGRIVKQVVGYNEAEFKALLQALEGELARVK